MDARQDLHPIDIAQHQIQKHHVRVIALKDAPRLFPRRRGQDIKAFLLQHDAQRLAKADEQKVQYTSVPVADAAAVELRSERPTHE